VAQIQISMLGPLALAVDGRPVVVAGRRRRALIARLALDPGRPVSMYRLAEDLWENDDERRSLPTLRTYVAKLRQLIPHGTAILVSEPAGYALALDVDSVDAFRFEQLVHGAGGDDRHVERVLTEALSMWRGNALEEFAHLDWARPLASRLDETRLFAYERLFDTQLALGQHAAIVDTLTALVHLHPLRERFHVQLATALYRSGRQADALDTQRRARTLLLHELGIDPGRELAALERQILEHDSVLAPPNATVATTNEVWASRLPVALQPRAHDPPFVGRDDELARIADRFLRLDGAHLVAITGEAGIGKTRLAAEAAEAAVAAGAAVLYGSCDEHLDLPYQPYVEALRDFASRGPLEGLASRLGSDAGALVPLLPALAPYLPIGPAVWASSDPSAEQHRLFEAVLGWFTAMAETQPLVFVIDDLQWAAGVTTLLTGHVLRRLRDRAVLFIATIRTDERGRDDVLGDVMARLHRDRVVDTLALAGLDATAAAQLVAAEGHALTDHAIDALWRATAGNPFLFTETMRSAAMNADTIPSSIRNVLLPRARRLDAPAQELLATASVVGLEFDLDTVAAAAELSEDTSLAALDEAIASGYVVTIDGATSRVAFRHAIAQRTLYEANSVVRRATLHRRVAEVMEARAGDDVTMADAAELARQWREAGSPHRRAASLWSARAGRLAMQQFAYDAAATHLEQAVALADTADDRERLVLLLDLARAHTRAANAVRGRAVTMRAVELARKVGDPVALAHASLGTAAGGRGVSSWIADDLRVEALAEAYQGLTDDTALRVRVGGELALALYLPEQRHRRQTIAREAVELAQAEGSPAAIAAALAASRVALWRPEHTPRRLDFARTVEAIAVADGDVWLEASALDYLRGDCNELGDRAGFDRAGARIQELAARTGGVLLAWRAGVVATHNALLAGAFADAERLAHEALARWQDDPAPDAVQTFGYHIGLVRIGQGRHAEAVDLVESAVKMWPNALGLYAALASQCAAAGDTERALGLVEACVADDLALMPQDSGWLISLVFLADAAARLRHESAMTTLTEILTPFADRFAAIAGPDTSMGSVAAVLGALATGRGDRAAATMWWERACRLEEGFGDVRSLERSRARLAATR
jgi:DNA-binding SARP family transcriptional activator/predicted ATPase